MNNIAYLYLIAIPPLAICFGIFGSFSMWDKTSFFGHSFSHSLLFPLSLAFLCNTTMPYSILLFTILFAIIFVLGFCIIAKKYSFLYSYDTILIIISFFFLAMSLFISSFYNKKIDIMMYISGDIMFISNLDLILLYLISGLLIIFTFKFYKILLLRIISSELAISSTKNANLLNQFFMVLYGIFIAISIRAIGVLLISATVLMPSIIARLFAKTPLGMIYLSIFLGFIIMNISAVLSLVFNIQFGPITIIIYCILIALCYVISLFTEKI